MFGIFRPTNKQKTSIYYVVSTCHLSSGQVHASMQCAASRPQPSPGEAATLALTQPAGEPVHPVEPVCLLSKNPNIVLSLPVFKIKVFCFAVHIILLFTSVLIPSVC